MTTSERLEKVVAGVSKTKDLNAELEKSLYGTDTGGKSYYDEFWDNYQQNGTRIYYPYAFAYSWNDAIYKPKYDITNAQNIGLQYLFAYSTVTDTIVTIDASKATKSQHIFDSNRRLRTIRKLIVSENNGFNTWFRYCEDLETLIVEGTIGQNGFDLQWSKNLSKASIESIINHLSTTTSGLTVTLSKTAVNNAFTTDEWNALIGTRTNWTISLV